MPPARRRDAERNRNRLLAVAAEVVAERGPEAPLSEISSRAGVGAGTLYRHFPTRESLLVALFDARVDELCAAAVRAGDTHRPAVALRAWMLQFVRHALTDNGLAETIDLTRGSADHDCAARIEAAAARLLDAAQQAGVVTATVDAGQLIRLCIALALAADDLDQAASLIAIAWSGLAASPLPRG